MAMAWCWALLMSLLLHVLIYAVWPHLRAVQTMPVHVQGELLASPTEQPPPPVEPPPAPPEAKPEPQQELPPPKPHDEQNPAPGKTPDSGVALPLIAEKADTVADAGDYVVPEAPPLAPGDNLPFASKVGDTPLERYVPGADTVTSAPSGGSEDEVNAETLKQFGAGLRGRAAQTGGYPQQALRRGWQGRVKVLVRFARDGQPYRVEVKESSGHAVLDERAVEMVRQACTDFLMPEELQHKAFSVVVPVDFKLAG